MCNLFLYKCAIYIYIYIYIEREREREREAIKMMNFNKVFNNWIFAIKTICC